jgi:hypothetical protein
MYSTLSASNYMAAIVTDEFLQGVAWNTSNLDHLLEDEAIGQRQLVRLQSNVDHLTRLENQDCIRAYGTNFLQSSWKNVLIVSDANVTGPFVIGYYHRADLRNDDLAWICGKQGQMNTRCDTQMMLSHPTNWIIADIEMHQSNYRGGAAGLPYFEDKHSITRYGVVLQSDQGDLSVKCTSPPEFSPNGHSWRFDQLMLERT